MDTIHNQTGLESLRVTYLQYEIMFNVSTLLPYSPKVQLLTHTRYSSLLRVTYLQCEIMFHVSTLLPYSPKEQLLTHVGYNFLLT